MNSKEAQDVTDLLHANSRCVRFSEGGGEWITKAKKKESFRGAMRSCNLRFCDLSRLRFPEV